MGWIPGCPLLPCCCFASRNPFQLIIKKLKYRCAFHPLYSMNFFLPVPSHPPQPKPPASGSFSPQRLPVRSWAHLSLMPLGFGGSTPTTCSFPWLPSFVFKSSTSLYLTFLQQLTGSSAFQIPSPKQLLLPCGKRGNAPSETGDFFHQRPVNNIPLFSSQDVFEFFFRNIWDTPKVIQKNHTLLVSSCQHLKWRCPGPFWPSARP